MYGKFILKLIGIRYLKHSNKDVKKSFRNILVFRAAVSDLDLRVK
tara:strand:- start:22811 stop:22945 length:135 start_codon:yes stop_codon:yes gene_type:complete